MSLSVKSRTSPRTGEDGEKEAPGATNIMEWDERWCKLREVRAPITAKLVEEMQEVGVEVASMVHRGGVLPNMNDVRLLAEYAVRIFEDKLFVKSAKMSTYSFEDVAKLLDLDPDQHKSYIETIDLIKTGLPYACLSTLSVNSGLTIDLILKNLKIALRTINRSKYKGRLNSIHSEKILRLTRLIAHAKRHFLASDKANEWLLAPNAKLNNQSPISLMDTSILDEEVHFVLVTTNA